MKPVKITILEKEVLLDIASSDHSSDQQGYVCYTDWSYFSIPMKIVRGVISSLIKKGIIHYTEAAHGMGAYVMPDPKYVSGENWLPTHEYFGNDPFGIEGQFGFRYINLEWD